MTIVEVLKAARALIDTPEKWTKWDNAQRSDGASVAIADSQAYKFCASAAIVRVWAVGCAEAQEDNLLRRKTNLDAVDALRKVVWGERDYPIAQWNDAPERTHAEVMEAFDKAIAEAQ